MRFFFPSDSSVYQVVKNNQHNWCNMYYKSAIAILEPPKKKVSVCVPIDSYTNIQYF